MQTESEVKLRYRPGPGLRPGPGPSPKKTKFSGPGLDRPAALYLPPIRTCLTLFKLVSCRVLRRVFCRVGVNSKQKLYVKIKLFSEM